MTVSLSYNDLIAFADNLNQASTDIGSVTVNQAALEQLLGALVRNTTDLDYRQYADNFEHIISPVPVDSNCGSAVGYYWELSSRQFGNYLNSTAWQSRYKDITFPGKCVKRYLGNKEGDQITTYETDPYGSTSLGNDTYSCLPYGTVLAETKFPTGSASENEYIISGSSPLSINKECATNPINYGGTWDDNNGYVNSKGATNPGESTGAQGGPPGVTRNCEVKKLISKYVWKGDFEDNSLINECHDRKKPLYPGSAAAATMDVPSDDAKQWWKDNSCIWIHLLKTDNSLASTYNNRYYEPAVLNGKCGFGDFTIDDPNFKDLGSNASGAIDTDTSTSLNVALTHDELIQGLEKQDYSDSEINNLLTNTNQGITPLYRLPIDNVSPFGDDLQCSWVSNDDIIQASHGNPLKPDVDNDLARDDITGQFKKYARHSSNNRNSYSYPTTIGENNIVLDNIKFRAYDYVDNNIPDDEFANVCGNKIRSSFEFNTTPNDIKWLSGSDVNKINEGSNLILNDYRIKKINLEDPVLDDNNGDGSGECWQKVRLTSVPNYVQYKAPVRGADNPLFENSQISANNVVIKSDTDTNSLVSDLLLKHIPSYGSANEESIYKNMALMNKQVNSDGDPIQDNVFFKRNPEDCASADDDVVADSLGSLKYAWIDKNGSGSA
jgi:hypothetical protein